MPKIKRLIIHYTDLRGFIRSVERPYENNNSIENIIATTDGSSVYGFENIERSDLVLKPDLSTLTEVPWNNNVTRSLAMIYTPDGERYNKDPRFVAEKTNNLLRELGYKIMMGAELEFFLLKKLELSFDEHGLQIFMRQELAEDSWYKKIYHETDSQDPLFIYRLRLIEYLENMRYGVETSHHEVARSQIELSLKAGDPVYLGDEIVTTKWVAKHVANEMGMRPVFMPKPLYEMNGNGLHLHISLWRDDKNLFYDTNGLSDVARYFIGGLIEHCRSLAAIIAPTTNSYKRLVPGYEAPVYCLWSRYNRSVAIRIPYASDERRVRIEFRPPDPSSNPYLAVSAVILAGLDGINRKIDPGPEFVGNAYKLSQEDIKRDGIKTLPRNLEEALEELENDHDYLKPVFSKDLVESYIEIKREEIREIDKRPSPYEFMLYADI